MPFFLQQYSGRARNAARAHMHSMITLDITSWHNGVRMTIITVAPILLGALTGQLVFGVMAFLSALCVAFADVGGAYRNRARAMFSAALFMTVTVLVATLVGANLWLATLLMFAWAFLSSIVGIYGNLASKVSFSIICFFVLVMGQPAGIGEAWIRVLAFIIGTAWAMVISLWLWPFRPFLPARQAVSAYYLALSALLRKASSIGEAQCWNEGVKQERARLLETHDKAHQIVAARPSQRSSSHPLNSLLLMLVLQGDTIMEAVIALAEELASARTHTLHQDKAFVFFVETMEHCAALLEHLARTIADEKQDLRPEILKRSLNALAAQEYALRLSLPQLDNDYFALVNTRNLANLLKRMGRLLRETRDLLTQSDNQEIRHEMLRVKATGKETSSWKAVARERALLLKEHLTLRSFLFRHALRLATISAVAVAMAKLLHIPNGNWIVLTILFILRPDYGTTRERAFQRMVGTLIGGILATLLVVVLHGNALIFPVLIVISFFCFAHQNTHHVLFVQFLTISILLMSNLMMPGDWLLAFIRIANTLVGGGLGILACYFFWPQWERERLPQQMGRTILANRAYITSVLTAYMAGGDKKAEWEAVRQASKAAHLQNVNAAAAFQRLLNEPKTSERELEHFSILITYNQRVCDSVTALAAHIWNHTIFSYHIPTRLTHEQAQQLKRFRQQLQWMLRDVEDANRTGQHLGVNPSFEETLRDALTSLQNLLENSPVESSTPWAR